MSEAVNVAKYNAGGSGDNYIPDGYIKTVEKIWMDSYTIATLTTTSVTTIDIAVLPKGKKITSIEVQINSATTQTQGTIAIGFSTDASVDTFFSGTVTHNLTISSIGLPLPGFIRPYDSLASITTGTLTAYAKIAGFQYETTGTQTTISVKLTNWQSSTGTLKSIVRYV